MRGVLSGKMVMRLVEAIDVYLAGTVMLIFAMGLYGLFISNTPDNIAPADDRALKGSSLFGMFALRVPEALLEEAKEAAKLALEEMDASGC